MITADFRAELVVAFLGEGKPVTASATSPRLGHNERGRIPMSEPCTTEYALCEITKVNHGLGRVMRSKSVQHSNHHTWAGSSPVPV